MGVQDWKSGFKVRMRMWQGTQTGDTLLRLWETAFVWPKMLDSRYTLIIIFHTSSKSILLLYNIEVVLWHRWNFMYWRDCYLQLRKTCLIPFGNYNHLLRRSVRAKFFARAFFHIASKRIKLLTLRQRNDKNPGPLSFETKTDLWKIGPILSSISCFSNRAEVGFRVYGNDMMVCNHSQHHWY